MAKRKGYWVTTVEMCSLKKSKCPLKKVSPIQAIPKMATMAFIPAPKTLPFTASCTFALLARSIRDAVAIMTISMVSGIDTRCISSPTMNEGRRDGKLPNTTTASTPSKKATTAYLERGLGFLIISSIRRLSSSGLMIPSRTFSLYIGSSTNSFPTWFCTKAARMAMKEAGIQTRSMVPSSTPLQPSKSVLMMAAVAADTGLPVIPKEAAMVATLRGRSGRILELVAISEMIGSSE